MEATGQVGREFPRRTPSPRPAAPGPRARRTRGSDARCSRTRCRRRRCTRWRVTEFPTALFTTNPTRGPVWSDSSSRWTTRVVDPARRRDRTARRKDSLSVSRYAAGNTGAAGWESLAVRRRGSCGPCDDAKTEWSGRRGCACAGGNRAPCAGDGCSAGTYACSRASLSVVFRDVHTGGISSAPFGWHRPPTALQHPPWTCGTGRHQVTGQRYALRSGRVKPRASGTLGEPVDEVLPARTRRLLRSAHRGSPPPADQPDHDPRVTHATVVANGPLNWENVVQLAFTVRLGQGLCARQGSGSQPVDKTVDRTPDRRPERMQRRRREPWSRQRRTSALPGAASSTTSSPTSGRGSGRASRSPSTRARPSSPCPTSSPAASSRAGSAASSRTRSPCPSAARSGSRSP